MQRPNSFNSMVNGGLDQDALLEAYMTKMQESNPTEVIEEKEQKTEPQVETVEEVKPEPVATLERRIIQPKPQVTVSETFSSLLAAAEMEQQVSEQQQHQQVDVIEAEPTVKEEKSIIDVQELLKSISIDVNNIELSSAPIDTIKINKKVKESAKTTSQIVACQSAYKAFMSALSSQEIQNLIDSDTDFYTFKKMIYQAVHRHMEQTSLGKMDFPTFLKTTSFFDIDTFLYGIYCQTFPYENKYTLTCPDDNCGKDFPMVVNNRTLVETRGEKGIFERIDSIVASIKSPKDLEEHSLLYKVHRVALEESKMIVEVQIPSLHDYLEGLLANTDRQFAEEYAASMGLSLFIRKLYVPDLITLRNTGKLTYFELTNKKEITMAIADLSYYDGLELSDAIDDYTGQYRVSYSIKNVTCPHCAHVVKEVPINIEQMLFHVIRQGRPKKDENNEPTI